MLTVMDHSALGLAWDQANWGRVVTRVTRNKDHPQALGNATFETIAVRCPHELEDRLERMIQRMGPLERIYMSLNPRDLRKSSHAYRVRMMEALLFSDPYDFYFKADPAWHSCMGQPNCAATTSFLFDTDTPDERDEVNDNFLDLTTKGVIKTLYAYNTVQGRHYITNPFNPALLTDTAQRVLKKDAMLLLAYTGDSVLFRRERKGDLILGVK